MAKFALFKHITRPLIYFGTDRIDSGFNPHLDGPVEVAPLLSDIAQSAKFAATTLLEQAKVGIGSANSTPADHNAPLHSAQDGTGSWPSVGIDAEKPATSDIRASFEWHSDAKVLTLPTPDHAPGQAHAAMQKAIFSASVSFIKHAPDQDQPLSYEGDIGYARVSGSKGPVKSAPAPAPTEPAPAPAPVSTAPAVFDYLSGKDTPNGFNVGLVFEGTGWTDALKQGFHQAAEYLSDIILDDLASVTTSTGVVDDIRIKVSLTAIDGVGGLGGWGEYTSVRSGSLLPSEGAVRMDVADSANWLAKGIWDDFALHEMLHCLGFGTAWNAMGLVKDYSGDLRFTGAAATAMYNTLYPLIAGPDLKSDFGVPVETDGGPGTAGVHWDDATFKSEIMTGTLNYTNVVSDMTIAALEDMGYNTIYVPQMSLI